MLNFLASLVNIRILIVPLPEPMLLPYPFIHFVNWDPLRLRKKENSKNTHDNNPGSEEEENPRSHVA